MNENKIFNIIFYLIIYHIKKDHTETINFRNNLIADIAETAFLSQNKLKSLTLSNNKLTRIPSKALMSSKFLKELFLDHNGIQTIRQKAFEKGRFCFRKKNSNKFCEL